MLNWLRNRFAPKRTAPPSRLSAQRLEKLSRIAGAYDAAQTSDYNVRHWRNADELSADSANSLTIRKTIRSRARYEAQENNSYAKGICLTLANDVIGRGPRLQLLSSDKAVNRQIEQQFSQWARSVQLSQKHCSIGLATAKQGQAFAMFTSNRRLSPFGVQLDLKLIECDQVTDPSFIPDPRSIDGIKLDDDGNPISYQVLKNHPGDTLAGFNPFRAETVDADDMLHIFRCDRAGQHRGVSELTPALPLFAMLRDYSLAVLSAAKTAAKFAAVLETQAGARQDDGQNWDPDVEAFDAVDIDYDMMTSVPFGWTMKQFKAEQPTTTFQQFRDAILNEIARCLNMPFNVAAGNSAGYNYASGRLDHQTYFMAIDIERQQWEAEILDRIFAKWLDEALLIPGLIPGLETGDVPHQWYWDGREHVDPSKEANAQAAKLKSGTTHRVREYALIGQDVDAEDEKAAASYGVTVAEYRAQLFKAHFSSGQPAAQQDQEDSDDTDVDEDEEKSERKAAAAAR